MTVKILTTAIATTAVAIGTASISLTANAGMVTDGHGNVGYDSYDECVMAVQNGSAKFYQPYTYQSPKRRATETAVEEMTLAQMVIPQSVVNRLGFKTNNYQAGACDLGTGRAAGRYGVSAALIGKYVPFAPTLPINVYLNRQHEPMRITMHQCDNHFANNFPVPIVPLPIINTINPTQAQTVIKQERHIRYVKAKPDMQATQANDMQIKQLGIPIMNTVNPVQAQAIVQHEQPSLKPLTTNEVRHIRVLTTKFSNVTITIQDVDTDNEASQTLPVIRTPDYDGKLPIYNPKTGQYDLVDE